MNVETKILRPAERLLSPTVEQKVRRAILDKVTGNVVLEMKEGRVLRVEVKSVTYLTADETG